MNHPLLCDWRSGIKGYPASLLSPLALAAWKGRQNPRGTSALCACVNKMKRSTKSVLYMSALHQELGGVPGPNVR